MTTTARLDPHSAFCLLLPPPLPPPLFQAYGKTIVKGVPLKTMSGPVIYTNLLGFVPMLMLANVSHEYGKFWEFFWADDKHRLPPISIFLLILGSVVGTGIGYSGWWCRNVVSATSFTLIGGTFPLCLCRLCNGVLASPCRSFYVRHAGMSSSLRVRGHCYIIRRDSPTLPSPPRNDSAEQVLDDPSQRPDLGSTCSTLWDFLPVRLYRGGDDL